MDSLDKWKPKARHIQNSFGNYLGTREYDEVDITGEEQMKVCKDKVGFAIFNYPTDSGYTEKQKELIDNVITKIINHSTITEYRPSKINFALLYVVTTTDKKKCGIEVIFRVAVFDKNKIKKLFFIDLALRVYTSWKDYLDSNKLPKCYMCWPQDGIYSKDENGTVKIKFGWSHACGTVNKVLAVTDITSIVGGTIGLGVTVASLFTPLALPIVIGASVTTTVAAVYDVGRSIFTLVDLNKHDIEMTGLEAVVSWFSIITSALGAVSSSTTTVLKSVKNLSIETTEGLLKAFRILNLSMFCMNGVAGIAGIINVVIKCIDGTLERKDILQFTLSCLFLFNAVISIEIADRMIREITHNHISVLNHAVTTCKTVVNGMLYVQDIAANYGKLLALIIGAPFVCIVGLNSERISCSVLRIASDTLSLIKLEIDFEKYASNVSQTLEELYYNTYREIVDKIRTVTKWRFSFNPKIASAYFTHKNEMEISRSLNVETIYQLSMIVRNFAESFSFEENEEEIKRKEVTIMRRAYEFDSIDPSQNVNEYILKLKFFCEHLKVQFQKLKEKYECMIDEEVVEDFFNQAEFNAKNGIEYGLNRHCFDKIIQFRKTELTELQNKYEISVRHNLKTIPNNVFVCKQVFPYFYPPNMITLTEKEYFSYATEFSGIEITEKTSKIFKDDRLVALIPGTESKVPRVLFYKPSSSTNDSLPMGIAVVEKSCVI